MTSKETIDILFFGDLVGQPGRAVVTNYLQTLSEANKPDVIIANAENVTHGFGFSEKHYNQLSEAGINIFTSGNHIWDRKEIFTFIRTADRLLVPGNFPNNTSGVGFKVFTIGDVKIGVINLIGQVFMANYNSPWEVLPKAVEELKKETPVIFLDLHAEATSEKLAMGWLASELGVSAMVGTHTHVQTADNRIMNGTMGYLTDAGFNGAHESVIGMSKDCALQRFKSNVPTRLEVAESEDLQVNAVRFTVDIATGHCQKVTRVNEIVQLSNITGEKVTL